ncbi:MAG: MATE family efflux transporter [Armatimonadota bacterium]
MAQAMIDKNTEDLGDAPILPLLVRLSIPGIIGMLVMSLYNIVDTYWVSGIDDGTNAIAALTILWPIQMISAAIAMGTGVGVSSLVSRRSGQGRHEAVGDAAGHGIVVPFLVGAVMLVVCASIPRQLAVVFGAPPEVVEYTAGYLRYLAWGFPAMFVVMSFNGFYRGMGNAVTPMLIMITSAVTNMMVDPFLIYGWGPFPELGIEGAGISTVIAEIAALTLSMGYFLSPRSPYTINWHNLRLQLPVLSDIAQVGAPSAAMAFLRPLVGIAFNWALYGFGPEAIAAQGIGMRVMGLMVAFAIGLHQGLLPIVGFNFGAKNLRRMWKAFVTAVIIGVCMGLVFLGMSVVGGEAIVRLFTDEPELISLAMLALLLKVASMPFMEPQMMTVALLEGMGDGKRALLLTLCRQLLFVLPLLWLLPHFFGVTGVFVSQTVASVLSVAVAAWLARNAYRRYPPEDRPSQEAAVIAAK